MLPGNGELLSQLKMTFSEMPPPASCSCLLLLPPASSCKSAIQAALANPTLPGEKEFC